MPNHFSILALRIWWIVWKGKKIWLWKMSPPGQKVSNMILMKNREVAKKKKKIRGWAKVEMTQLQMCLVVKVKSDSVKNDTECEPGMLSPWIQVSWKWPKRRWSRVNINILGISELKWMGMGKFNSHDHYIYYCRQKFLRSNRAALIVNKRVQNAALGYNLRNSRMILVHFWGKSFNTTVIQVYATTTNVKEAETEWFCENLQGLVELTSKKDVLFGRPWWSRGQDSVLPMQGAQVQPPVRELDPTCCNFLWHCLSLGLEWKLIFSSLVATAEFSKFAGILSAALSQHPLSGPGTAQLEFHHRH